MQSAADDGPERASQGRGGPAGVRQGARDPVEERVARAPADEEPRSCGYARPPADAGPPGHPGANPDRPTRSGHRGSSRTACRPARTGGEVRDGYPSGAPLAPSRTVREGGAAPITAVRGRTGGRTAGAVREFRRGGPHRPGGPPPPSDPATRRATSRCPVRRTVTGDRREGTRSSGPAAEIGLEAGRLVDRVTTEGRDVAEVDVDAGRFEAAPPCGRSGRDALIRPLRRLGCRTAMRRSGRHFALRRFQGVLYGSVADVRG